MLLFYVQSSRLADMPESMSAPRKGTQTHVVVEGRPAVFGHEDRLDEDAHLGPAAETWRDYAFVFSDEPEGFIARKHFWSIHCRICLVCSTVSGAKVQNIMLTALSLHLKDVKGSTFVSNGSKSPFCVINQKKSC